MRWRHGYGEKICLLRSKQDRPLLQRTRSKVKGHTEGRTSLRMSYRKHPPRWGGGGDTTVNIPKQYRQVYSSEVGLPGSLLLIWLLMAEVKKFPSSWVTICFKVWICSYRPGWWEIEGEGETDREVTWALCVYGCTCVFQFVCPSVCLCSPVWMSRLNESHVQGPPVLMRDSEEERLLWFTVRAEVPR